MENKLKMSERGLQLITDSEHFFDKPYNDPSQNATIGWGHLLHKGPVTPADWEKYGGGISRDTGLAFLRSDVAWVEHEINTVVKVQLNQNQFDAVGDFTFNEGSGTLERSSVLTLLNEDKFPEACVAIELYRYSDHKVLPGLITRRKREVELFQEPVEA